MSDEAPPEPPVYEIVIEARRDPPAMSEHELDRERVLKTPGTFEDPVRLVQSLPGAAITPEYGPNAGDIAVRGSYPSESRFLLDGIELPYLFHFNGYSSVFHARLLDDLTLHPSTFGAPWGRATGAIVETRSTWERPERTRASANLNAIMGGAELALPVGRTWALRGGARRSYLDAFSRDDEQYTLFPAFWDHFARIEHTPSAGARWGLVSIGAGDRYERYAGEPTALDPYEQSVNPTFDYRQQYQIAAIVHRHVLPKGRLDGNLAATWHSIEGTLPAASEAQTNWKVQAREDATWLCAPPVNLAFGVDAQATRTHLYATTERAWSEVAREAPLLARGVSVDERIDRAVGGGYAEARVTAGPVRVVPGIRLDADTLSEETAFDGRFNVRWLVAGDTRVRAGAGTYSQFPTTLQLAPGTGDPTLGRSVSRQVAAGVETALAQRWEFGIEGYGKWSEGLIDQEVGEAPRGGVSGRAWGVELTSRYRLRELFFTWFSAAIARSERSGRTADYDQPWAFNVVGSWTFIPTWNAGVRYRASAGLPYTPIEDGLYLAADDTYAPIEAEPNSARLPPYHKVDVHLEKTFSGRRWSLTPYAELWWVPSGSNTMYYAWRYDYDAVTAVHGPALVPLLGLRGEM